MSIVRGRATRILAILLFGLSWASSGFAAPRIEVPNAQDIVLGDPIEIRFEEIPFAASPHVQLDLTDAFGAVWRSDTALTTEMVEAVPGGQAMRLRNSHRLFWGAARVSAPENVPSDQVPQTFVQARLTLSWAGGQAVSFTFRQWVQRPGVVRSDAANGVVGSLYSPTHASGVGVLVIGGSGGGMTWSQQIAAVLASHGYHALGVAYFNARTLPTQVDRIPLEYFRAAIDQLRSTPGVNPRRIVVLGQSWGSQAALLLGTLDADLGGIIAYVPGSAAFQGILPPQWPLRSSWSWQGRDIPFAAQLLDDGFSEPEDSIERWMMLLANRTEFEKGAIAIDRVRAPVLLLSARADRIWPSTYMSEQLIHRARAANASAAVFHESYPNAGHGITQPPFTPTTTVGARNGGTPEGNAAGRLGSWSRVLSFLDALAHDDLPHWEASMRPH